MRCPEPVLIAMATVLIFHTFMLFWKEKKKTV